MSAEALPYTPNDNLSTTIFSHLLVSSQNTHEFHLDARKEGLMEKDFSHIIVEPSFRETLEWMLGRPESNPLQLGIIFSYIQPGDIPDLEIEKALDLTKGKTEYLVFSHPVQSETLCGAAEKRMVDSAEIGALLRVNEDENKTPILIAKFDGKKACLCTKSTQTVNGVLIKNNWYKPDKKIQVELQKNFGEGKKQASITSGTFTLLRPLQPILSIDKKPEYTISEVFDTAILGERKKLAQPQSEIIVTADRTTYSKKLYCALFGEDL